MTRLPMIDAATANERVSALLSGVLTKRGYVPHMVKVLANSPAALSGFLGFRACLDEGVLPAGLRERIAVAIAAANACAPCLEAHTAYGRLEGLSDRELFAARHAEADDAATRVALRFALAVMRNVGRVSDQALSDVRAAGYDDAAIVEIIAAVLIDSFTNTVSHVAQTVPDPPINRERPGGESGDQPASSSSGSR